MTVRIMCVREVPAYTDIEEVWPNIRRGSAGSAGIDLQADIRNPVEIPPLGTASVPTNIAVDLTQGYIGLVTPRSGLAAKYGITVLNAPGLIDTDYMGEIIVVVHNSTPNKIHVIDPGDRIAQLLILPWKPVQMIIEDPPAYAEWRDQTQTTRGTNGFGSSGD